MGIEPTSGGWEQFAVVAVTYPSDSDPKNIRYVLWKNGLYGMNLDTATGTMIAMTGDTLDLHYVIKDC
jgi:hypothetical protein